MKVACPDYDVTFEEFTQECEKFLKSKDIYEEKSEILQRRVVLSDLNNIFDKWVQDLCIERKVPELQLSKMHGKIMCFGSYRLSVFSKGADIDVLCLAPFAVKRKDFFTTFVSLLKTTQGITNINAIEGAYVPVLKIKHTNIELDLVFASLALGQNPLTVDLHDDEILKFLDETSTRSINGVRVTDDILSSVPDRKIFRSALMIVKYWAKQRCIYSNAFGYLGGVSWAIMTAFICKHYPDRCAGEVFERVIFTVQSWKWPAPVIIKTPYEVTNINLPQWNPKKNILDSKHPYPIITPSFPVQNSTFNVSDFTYRAIERECERATLIIKDLHYKKGKIEYVFEPSNFFTQYSHYFMFYVYHPDLATSAKWGSYLESKMRLFLSYFYGYEDVREIHLFPKKILKDEGSKGEMYLFFFGIHFSRNVVIAHQNKEIMREAMVYKDFLVKKAKDYGFSTAGVKMGCKLIDQLTVRKYIPASMIVQTVVKFDVTFTDPKTIVRKSELECMPHKRSDIMPEVIPKSKPKIQAQSVAILKETIPTSSSTVATTSTTAPVQEPTSEKKKPEPVEEEYKTVEELIANRKPFFKLKKKNTSATPRTRPLIVADLRPKKKR